MPEYFDDDIPVARRKAKCTRIFRNTRRIWPHDVISKYIFYGNECNDDIFYDHNLAVFRANVKNDVAKDAVAVANKPNCFGINRFEVCYSLNKRKRWEIPDILSRRIVDQQDEQNHLRVSHYKEIYKNYCMKTPSRQYSYNHDFYQNDAYIVPNSYWRPKSYAIEFATVKQGEEIHKFYKNAFPKDLFIEPRPPREKSRRNLNDIDSDDSNDSDNDDSNKTKETRLHTLYVSAQTKWDRRVQKRHQKFIKKEREDGKKIIIKKNIRKCDDLSSIDFSANDMDLIEDSYDEVDCRSTIRRKNDFRVSIFSACFVDRKLKKIKKRRRQHQVELSESASVESPIVTEMEEVLDTTELYIKTILDKTNFLLPSVDIRLPLNMNFADYIQNHFPSAYKIQHMYPETYISYVSNKTIEGSDQLINCFNGWITFRIIDYFKDDYTIRFILNANENDVPQSKSLESSTCSELRIVEKIPSFLSSFISASALNVCSSSSACDKIKHISDWLHKMNEKNISNCEPTNTCNVCYNEDPDGFSLLCGHYFCRFCWTMNAMEFIQQYRCPITCMMTGCSGVIELDHIVGLLKHSFCQRYEDMLWNKLILIKRWIYCEKCSRLMILNEPTSSGKTVAICECGTASCLKCKTTFHAPLSCDLASEYKNILSINDENNNEIISRKRDRMQRCPSCMQGCVKIDGCLQVVCSCGADFCYACGNRYSEFVSHEECNYDDKPEEVSLFDVRGVPNDKNAQLAFEMSYFYREKRTFYAIKKLKTKLSQIVNNGPIFRSYIAANEVLELNSFYQFYARFLKKKRKSNKQKFISNDIPVIQRILVKRLDCLQFVHSRLISTIENDNRNIKRCLVNYNLLVKILHDVLSCGYLYL